MRFVVLGSDVPWVRGLCEGLLDVGVDVQGLNLIDVRNVVRGRKDYGGRLREKSLYVPPSYGTRLAALCGGYLAKQITDLFRTANDTWLVATNPVFEQWTRKVPDDRLIYWTFDDYELYQPSRAIQIRNWEATLLQRAAIVLCSSKFLLDRIRSRTDNRQINAYHFPNAVETEWLNHLDDASVERGSVGYIGNMSERVDWDLVYEVIFACPSREFVFVGDADTGAGAKSEIRRRALALPNAKCLGQVPHSELWRHYHTFEVNWMPYDVGNPFNQACCPTKIFDALSTGRPFLSTAVPECLLYPDHIKVLDRTTGFDKLFREVVGTWTDGLARRQIAFAARNDWRARASSLLEFVDATRDRACSETQRIANSVTISR